MLVVAFIAALLWLPSLSGQFMPEFEEGHFVVQASSALPGTSFDEMLSVGKRISEEILALPYVATIEQQIGRAELGEDTWGPNRSEFHVELKPDPGIDQSEAEEAIRKIVESYPGLRTEVVTFLGDRFSESLTGETAAVVVNVFGDDLDALDATGARIAAALGGVAGIVDLQYERQSATPEVLVRPRVELLAAHGVTRRDLLEALQTAFAGLKVGETFAGARTVDAVVLLPGKERGPDRLRRPANRAEPVRAGASGSARGTSRPRSAARRCAISTASGASRSRSTSRAATFRARSRPRAADRGARGAAAPGMFVRFAGEAEAERQARLEIVLFAVVALVAVVLILHLAFRRRAYPWLVVVNLPFSLLGSIAAVGLTGIGLSLGTLVGLVTVFGVSSRNSILLLAHYEHLLDVEGSQWNRATALRGAAERLVPILMTALVTALALAPLAFGLGRAGYEIEAPMAITVLGGLATSTLLNLLVLPALANASATAPSAREPGGECLRTSLPTARLRNKPSDCSSIEWEGFGMRNWLGISLLVLLPAAAIAADAPPDWAYTAAPAGFQLPPANDQPLHVKGSTLTFTQKDVENGFNPCRTGFPASIRRCPSWSCTVRRRSCTLLSVSPGQRSRSSGIGQPHGLPAGYIQEQLQHFATARGGAAPGALGQHDHVRQRAYG